MIKLRPEWRNVKIGAEFHYLTILGVHFRVRKSARTSVWMCVAKCRCGITKAFVVREIHDGKQKSCGCYRDESRSTNGKNNIRHGESGTPLHNLWHLIKQRCTDPNQQNYPNYGGRGIRFHDEWLNNYEAFRDYALEHGYRPGLQIDRYPNVDGNYEPGNVRFVTCKDNCRNKRNNLFVTAWGETKSVIEWSEDARCKVSYQTLWRRLRLSRANQRWNPESAISTPSIRRGKRIVLPAEYLAEESQIKNIYEARSLIEK